MDATFFAKSSDLRRWFEKNHQQADELWVGFHKKGSGRQSITWPEAVGEALSVGWIDGIRKSIDEDSYRIRFTPRKPRGIWSSVNIKRANELIESGRMKPAGLEAFGRRKEDRSRQYSFEQGNVELGEAYEREFRKNSKAWSFFESQPPHYRKTVKWWVMSAKREETRAKRLATLIRDSAAGQRVEPSGFTKRK